MAGRAGGAECDQPLSGSLSPRSPMTEKAWGRDVEGVSDVDARREHRAAWHAGWSKK